MDLLKIISVVDEVERSFNEIALHLRFRVSKVFLVVFKKLKKFSLAFCIFSTLGATEAIGFLDSDAYWDYGVGFGALRFEHYPASEEARVVALPFPTFQYRGKILRADDRDGAHLYLFKGVKTTLEFSGQGSPALESSSNVARRGMPDLPWMLAIGPQLVFRATDQWVASFGIYQSITFQDFFVKAAGNIFEGKLVYDWTTQIQAWNIFEAGSLNSKIILSMKAGSKELNALYFQVPETSATAERPAYSAKAGLTNQSLSYYQSYHSGRAAFYLGGGLHSYTNSENRQSPLHKSDLNYVALIGFSYTLGESKNPAVPEEETSGVIQRLRRNRQLQPGI